MKCLNCGKEANEYLCNSCRSEEILDRVIEQIRFFKPDVCENDFLAEYAVSLREDQSVRDSIPNVLRLFSNEISEYYYCLYYGMCRKEEFEQATEAYLSKHNWSEKRSQTIIDYLLRNYIRNDFVKPRAWCDWIAGADGIYCELYLHAAMYYAMIAEYDLADRMADEGLSCDRFLYSSKEYMYQKLENQKNDTLRYRTKKPYWPKTEERRRAVAMFYDEKGIEYPRIESKPAKIPENEFGRVVECYELPENYCAFWCSEAFGISSARSIYQIAAVRVTNGTIQEEFQSLILPWDGTASRKSAAKESGFPLSVIEGAEDVDLVMARFFEFVGNSVLVSTEALGNQKKLLCRAVRYSGMKQLPNPLYDLLDLAADVDSTFDFENNNRAYLLDYFAIPEGTDAVSKAKANVEILMRLKEYGK